MKSISILFAALALSASVCAQKTVEASLAVKTGDQLRLDLQFADDIKVIVWNNPQVKVRATVNLNNNTDNDLFVLNAERDGADLRFKEDDDAWTKQCRDRSKDNDCKCCCGGCRSEIDYTVYMPASLDFYVKSISGSVVMDSLTGKIDINTISGNITLRHAPKDVHARTISGDVEFLVNKGDKADLTASTISGEIYSNLDIEYLDNKSGLNRIGGKDFHGRINGGGYDWNMETISGNIFLRAI